ncbi:unnamed protein product [Cyprideis torosa]|uniref:Reelin domain-containing protein n=1 Tax=Cyprideis torosa TaxID=163714 RepID=A0A7R8ZNM2_9CRUS|nr:unnamed protein product [Cyprideis torosa]CAG0896673.1 unnamed protein product [Cyprideis torosa]
MTPCDKKRPPCDKNMTPYDKKMTPCDKKMTPYDKKRPCDKKMTPCEKKEKMTPYEKKMTPYDKKRPCDKKMTPCEKKKKRKILFGICRRLGAQKQVSCVMSSASVKNKHGPTILEYIPLPSRLLKNFMRHPFPALTNRKEKAILRSKILKEEETILRSKIIKEEETILRAKIIKEEETILRAKIIKEEETILRAKIIKEEETILRPKIIKEEETILRAKIINEEETILRAKIINEEETILGPKIIKEEETILGPKIIKEEETILGPKSIKEEETILGPKIIKEEKTILGPKIIKEEDQVPAANWKELSLFFGDVPLASFLVMQAVLPCERSMPEGVTELSPVPCCLVDGDLCRGFEIEATGRLTPPECIFANAVTHRNSNFKNQVVATWTPSSGTSGDIKFRIQTRTLTSPPHDLKEEALCSGQGASLIQALCSLEQCLLIPSRLDCNLKKYKKDHLCPWIFIALYRS